MSVPRTRIAARATAALVFLCTLAAAPAARAAADVAVDELAAPSVATLGSAVQLLAAVKNKGTVALTGWHIGVYISPGRQISEFNRRLALVPGPDLAPGQTQQFPIVAVVPADVPARPWYFGVIAGPGDELGESVSTLLDNMKAASSPTDIRAPAPDLAAVSVNWATRAAAGETAPVAIVVENRGVLDGEALAVFDLSTNDTVSAGDLQVGQLRLSLAAGERRAEVAWVRLPAGLATGRYYIGLRIDPGAELSELSRANNSAVSLPADVASATLGVETNWLPDALVGVPYVRTLVAGGGDGPYAWRLAGGAFPPGISLSAGGLIAGTPAASGTFSPVVEVSSGTQSARAAYVLRCHAAALPLQVATSELPPAIVGADYSAPLAAAGGTPPFAWSVVSGGLPAGLVLDATGLVHGKATAAAPGQFTVEVRDASGASARCGSVQDVCGRGKPQDWHLAVRAIAAGDLAISQLALDDAHAGDAYLQKIDPAGGVAPYRWALASGRLPAGLALSPEGDSLTVTGKPVETGTFMFSLRLEDASGLADRNTYVLLVAPRNVSVLTAALPDALRGAAYDEELTAERDGTWRLVSGDLPPGFELTPAGHVRAVAGTVAERTPLRTWSFLVEVDDGAGGRGRAGYSIAVVAPAAPPEPGGCSGSAAGLPALALLGFGLLRRRRAAGLALAATMLFSAADAAAQTAATDYLFVIQPEASYPGITDGQIAAGAATALSFSGTDTGDSQITLPFAFPYYGQTYTTLKMGIDGYLSFTDGGREWHNQRLPSPSTPNAVVAPRWDDLEIVSGASAHSDLRWAIEGTAPHREGVFEWHNLKRYGASSSSARVYTFQVRLGEDGALSFHYAPLSGTPSGDFDATVGIESAGGTNGVMVLPCQNACTAQSFPAGQQILFLRRAELTIGGVAGPEIAWVGLPSAFTMTVRDAGSLAAEGVSARLYLSADGTTDSGDLLLVDTGPMHLDAAQSKTITTADGCCLQYQGTNCTSRAPICLTSLPVSTAPGSYRPIGVVDPGNVVDEADENNNVVAGGAVRVPAPAPDFTVKAVSLGTARAAPGDELVASLRLANQGNRSASTTFCVVLSLNDVVSLSDRPLATGQIDLPALSEVQTSAVFHLPDDLQPGTYRVGAVVDCAQDPARQTPEIDEFNNTLKADQTLQVSGPIAIVTKRLPDAAVGAFYAYRLQCTGGDGLYLWQLAPGSTLPGGLTLSPFGDVEGIPSQVDAKTFTVQVTSNTTDVVTQVLSVRVLAVALPLSLSTTELPAAIFGREYVQYVVAQGGQPPYRFALTGAGALPQGVGFDPSGMVGGVPAAGGDFPLRVRVTDARASAVEGDVVLHVLPAGRPVIDATPLPEALVREPYTAQLAAIGGRTPYVWSVERTRRMGTADEPGEELSGLPPGLEKTEDGRIVGHPSYEGLFVLQVSVKDAAGAQDRDNVILNVRADRGIAILTSVLPSATVGREYDEALVLTGGTGQATWSVIGTQPPDGLTLGLEDGHLTGTPATPGRATFVVKVMDEARRTDMRAVTILVKAPVVATETGGCSAFGGTGTALLAALLLLALRGRRRAASPGRPGMGGVAAAVLAACSTPAATKNPCDEVTCQRGEECDPADGTCRCGGEGGRACTLDEWCNWEKPACELLDRCKLVQCTRGMACDGTDGVCRCGAQVCGESELCDAAAKQCVAADRCALVTCAAGLSCDPSDGRCRCGTQGAECAPGERCLDGTCVADPCASVSCTGGTTCDPQDRVCRCGGAGGAQCLYGQTCVPTERRCVFSSRCATVRCSGGQSCDPADGACRCGGAGGPVCSAGQTCDQETRRCTGGDLCFGRTCPAGTECDPEDGLCHCGGAVCEANQLCEVAGTVKTCRTRCDAVAQTPCAAAETCVYNTTVRAAWCVTAGTKNEAASCAGSGECARGMHCVAGFGGGAGACRFYCARPGGSCSASGRTCRAFSGAPAELGACVP